MKKTALLFLIALIASGCIFRLIYTNLDWIIPWYVSDYITLNGEQDGFLAQQIKSQLKWHRVSQLPIYSQAVKNFSAAAGKGLTRNDLEHVHDTLRLYWQDLVRQISPDIADILISADDAQIKELLASFERKNREFKEKYIDLEPEKLRKMKVERMERVLDYFLGSLTQQQETIIEMWACKLAPIAEERLAYIKQIKARFEKMLANRHDKEKFKEDLRNLMFFNREEWPADFKAKAERNRELTRETFLEIDRTLSADQRAHCIEKLNALSAVMDELAAEVRE